MGPLGDEIDDFLTRYAPTLACFDAQAAASLWATSGMILDDQCAGVVEDHDAMVQGLERSYSHVVNVLNHRR